MSSFKDFHLKPYLYDALNELHFTSPTPVQKEVLPKAIKLNNLMVESATGSGKTHAFLIPIFQNLEENNPNCQAVIISPTRELSEQLYACAMQISKFSPKPISIYKAYGGLDRLNELNKIEKLKPQIVIGTIGRLHDLVINENILKIHDAKMVIIDEADMIFEQRELEEVDHLMAKFVSSPSFLIFSATMSNGLKTFLSRYFTNIETISLKEKNLTKTNIEHLMLQCKARDKEEVLLDLLKIINPYLCIIFANKKEDVDHLAMFLAQNGYKVGKLHADMESRERMQMIKRIRNLEYPIFVASDIAARGIDIDGVSHVINFDLPKDIEFYIHRTGRTARFDRTGQAYTLYSYDDDEYVKKLREKGLIVKFVKIVDNSLVQTKMEKPVKKTTSVMKQIEIDAHMKVRVPKKVKPGYKKKRMEEINKKIRQERKQHIKDIYKNRAKKQREEDFE